jgi:eukaryotic-like serine/threonine-protein kinase
VAGFATVKEPHSKRGRQTARATLPTATIETRRALVNSVLWLNPGVIAHDAISGRRYRVVRLLGQGGFGAAYQAVRLTRGNPSTRNCVLKVTIHAPTWHREAYFGYLFRHVPGLVQIYSSFAWAPEQENRGPLYCLVSEWIAEGDLGGYLERRPEPWPEARARREIIRLLRAITKLHESGAVHRDITPHNVFVTAGGQLKLGDFGIALHRVGRKDVAADAFAPRFAPGAIRGGAKSWRPADDVYQIGQLYAALLCGVGARKITPAEVKNLACRAHVKSVLQRCIGERRKCFASASEMLKALQKRDSEPRRPAAVRSLRGKRVVFTGGLSLRRADAKKLARKAGAIIENAVSQATDLIVVGDRSPHWKAEGKGQKLLDVDREAERGHKIAIVTESRFLALVRA